MTVELLSAADRDVIRQCVILIRSPRFIGEFEFEPRIGVLYETCDQFLSAWPAVDDSVDDSDACLIVNNALNEVCNGVDIPAGEWARWLTVPRREVLDVYRRWAALRGWSYTGLR